MAGVRVSLCLAFCLAAFGVADARELQIGFIAALSGPSASASDALRKGVDEAKQDPARGTSFQVEFFDSNGNPADAVSAVNSALGRDIRFIVAPKASHLEAARQVAQDAGMVWIWLADGPAASLAPVPEVIGAAPGGADQGTPPAARGARPPLALSAQAAAAAEGLAAAAAAGNSTDPQKIAEWLGRDQSFESTKGPIVFDRASPHGTTFFIKDWSNNSTGNCECCTRPGCDQKCCLK